MNKTQRKQIMIVVALSLGLVAALWLQPTETISQSRERTAVAASDVSVSRPATAAPIAVQADGPTVDQFQSAAIRPESRMELDAITRLKLFTVRLEELVPAADADASSGPIRVEAVYGSVDAESLPAYPSTKGGLSAQSPRLRSALVGQAIVRPGQSLPDGRRVVEVTTAGVAVAP